MKVAFAGGVTGGHIAPGVGLAERILRDVPGSDVLFASVANEVEEQMIRGRGLPLAKVAGRHPGAVGLAAAWLRARRLFGSFRPDLVVGLGGRASAGPAVAALMAGRPLVLLEQNAIPGRTNRWLAPRARAVFCQWKEAADRLGRRAAHTGSPVRREIAAASAREKGEARRALGLRPDLTTLLVMGGSQGAHVLNGVMVDAAAALAGRIQVVHLAGRADRPAVARAYRAAGLAAHLSGFLGRMDLAYAAADVALSRAGATSIAELAAAAVPALLVPYPHARDDHQRANARAAAAQGWAEALDQRDLTADRVLGFVDRVAGDAARRAPARPDAAGVMIERLRALLPGGGAVAATAGIAECAE